MGMILRIASSRIVGQGDIVGRSGYFSLNLSANSVMRGRLDARRTLKSLVADLRDNLKGLSKLIRGENVDKESAESLSEYMKKHKTEWALKLLEDESYNFNVPQYIMDAINWLIDGEK